MERIKKALAKANEKRDKVSHTQAEEFENLSFSDLNENRYDNIKSIKVSDEVLRKNRVISGLKEDANADLFKILRTTIIQKMRANNFNVLAITSPAKGAGKSLIASNLAISVAMDANYSVLLVDLDLRRPSLYKYFDFSPDEGIRDCFVNDKPLADVLIQPGIDSLVILPAGKPLRGSSELLSTPKMQVLANEIKHQYPDRMIIIDLPPLLQTDDAMVFMPNVDACLLVIEEGVTTEEEINRSLQMLDEEKFMGTILNKSTDALQQYGYY